MSFAAYMDTHQLPPAERHQVTSYVEGFNAADVTRISTQALAFQQAAENEVQGERLFHVKRGYSALVDYIYAKYQAADGGTHLQFKVQGIRWSKDKVTVTGTNSEEGKVSFAGRRVIIALPLGVLQSRTVEIDPWPESLEAIGQMVMGPVHRLTLVFTERFWARAAYRADDLSFLFAREATPSVWWTPYPSQAAVMTAWVGGTRVAAIPASELLDTALASLARIFNLPRTELDALLHSSHTHDWNDDPLSLGAYSYVCAGGIDASTTLSMPIDGTVFLAGEHTDVTGHWGTVHGALRSGVRAASQVMDSFDS